MTSRAWYLIVLSVSLVILALFTRIGAYLLLALPLLIYLAAGIITTPEDIKVQVDRTLSKNVLHQDEQVIVSHQVTNHGAALEEVRLETEIAERMKIVEEDQGDYFPLPAGSQHRFNFTLSALRGKYVLPDPVLIINGPSGLFETKFQIRANTTLTIMPEVARLGPMPIRPPQTRGFAGPIPSRMGGTGIDFFDVREFTPGDPFQRINWRLTARRDNEIYINQHEVERIADVGIMIDARHNSNLPGENDSLFEFSTQAAASLAATLLNAGNRVGLLVFGYGLQRVIPGYGRRQLNRILRALARAETGQSYSLNHLASIPARLFSPHSQLIVITPLIDIDPGIFVSMKINGYDVIEVSPNPIPYEEKCLASGPHLATSARLAGVERKLTLHRLMRAGIPVMDWNVEDRLEDVYQRFVPTLIMYTRQARR